MLLERVTVRRAVPADLESIREIYNQGIEDRCATLETDAYDAAKMLDWWHQHDDRYAVFVAADERGVVGWASLNRFSQRCAHAAIADLSVYVARDRRGRGIGKALLAAIDGSARAEFRKMVLHALNENLAGKRLYASCGFDEVGVFKSHGELDGRLVDVVAMEKLWT